jgi:hypothetical protein
MAMERCRMLGFMPREQLRSVPAGSGAPFFRFTLDASHVGQSHAPCEWGTWAPSGKSRLEAGQYDEKHGN